MTHETLARAANAVALQSRYGATAPRLSEASSLDVLTAWLQWCDPNGAHTPALAMHEDLDPHTLESAWTAIESLVTT